MEPHLVVTGLCKSFGDRTAVAGVSFSVQPGRVTGLIGPNGAGKTTTMRMILGIVPPDRGSVEVLGHTRAEEVRRRIGYLPEERGLYVNMTVREVITYFGRLHGLAAADARQASDRWLERLELGDRGRDRVDTLSKGLAQRVQFACALVHDPLVAILDEPMSGLDPIAADLLSGVIQELASKEGKTVLLSTHDLDGADRLCSSLVMIYHGHVVLEGETHEIKGRHGQRLAALIYDGDAEFLRSHPAVSRAVIAGSFAELQLRPDADVRQLLAECAERLDVQRFERVEPSLGAIFRQVVLETEGAAAAAELASDLGSPSEEPA